MPSRRDQLHSYQFMNQRVISAFVMRETDPAQSPLRRGVGALFGGLMVAILVAAGFGIYGIVTRSGTNQWQKDGSVVVERETGASFVYLRDRLHPTLNFTSAKLAAGRPDPPVFRIAAKALTGTARGVTIGIQGAPDSLPDARRQVGLPWTMCAVPGQEPRSVLLVASAGPAAAELGDRALLVSGADTFLIWRGRKHPVDDPRTTVPALFGAATPVGMGATWLNSLPNGAGIAAIEVAGRGRPSDRIPDLRNGAVLAAQTGQGDQFYLVLDDGLATITAVQQLVLNASFPATPERISVAEAARLPQSRALAGQDPGIQPPPAPPQLARVEPGESACAVTRDPAKPPALTVGGPAADFADAVPTTGAGRTGGALADAVRVPAGRFAIVRVPGSGGFVVVTDLGLRHAVPRDAVLDQLGYSAATATEVPTALVNALPAGVTLDPATATRPAPIG